MFRCICCRFEPVDRQQFLPHPDLQHNAPRIHIHAVRLAKCPCIIISPIYSSVLPGSVSHIIHIHEYGNIIGAILYRMLYYTKEYIENDPYDEFTAISIHTLCTQYDYSSLIIYDVFSLFVVYLLNMYALACI